MQIYKVTAKNIDLIYLPVMYFQSKQAAEASMLAWNKFLNTDKKVEWKCEIIHPLKNAITYKDLLEAAKHI
jgi:hypothetical protein